MNKYNRTPWIAGGVFVILLVFAVTWFAWASPNLADAKVFQEDTESAEDINHTHRLRLAKLQADYENIDEYRAELATLREQIPTTHEITELSRQLEAIAEDNDLFVVSILPDLPLQLDPADLVAEEEEPAETDSADSADSNDDADSGDAADDGDSDANSDGENETPAPAPSVTVPEGFTAVPISISILGSYDDARKFLTTVQEPENRLVFISSLNFEVQEETDESGGKPATEFGDVLVNLQGYAYLLPDGRPAEAINGDSDDIESVADGESAELPGSKRNPFGS